MNPQTPAGTETRPQKTTVLLVGTAPGDESTAAALRAWGYSVLVTVCPAEARRLLDSGAPDLVVIDAVGADSPGFATCVALRGVVGGDRRPVLLLTAPDDDEAVLRAYALGATDVFTGGRQWALLAGRLRALLRASHMRGELARSRAQLERAQDLARMGPFSWRRADGRLHLPPESRRVLALAAEPQPALRSLLRRMPREERALTMRMLLDLTRQNAPIATDLRLRRPDGRELIVHVEGLPELDASGRCPGYTGFLQDVTDRRAAEDKIRHLSNFDALTGLPNRRQLIWRAERALEHAQRLKHGFALLLIDLDRFKLVADTLGHAAGDELLVEVARRLRACLRHNEQVREAAPAGGGARPHRTLEAVGRLGGDEFVVLLPELADEHDVERVADHNG